MQSEHEKRYILPVGFDNWQMQTLENGIHSPYNTVLYDYSADRKMLSLPLISFYVPPENDSVQEIAVIFDWHSYSRELHELYEELCYYSVKTVLSELTEEQIVKLCSQINESGYDHAFSMDEWYGSGSVPYELFYKGNIGVYSHFAVGSRQRLCIIPVTEQTLEEFARRGVVINEIDTCVPAADEDSAESGLEKRLPATDEEKKDTEEKMRKAAGICAEHYLKAEKISADASGQNAISRSDIDDMEEALADAGYCVTDSDAVYPEYVKNPEALELFWKNVGQKKDAHAVVWSILRDGSLSCRSFRYADGKGSCLHAAAEWNEAGGASVTYLEKKEILFWDMTSSGFIYQDNYLNRHYNAAVLLRLKPVDRRLYGYTEKYIAPIGYHNVNLFLLDWSSGDFGHVCFNDLFSGLYLIKYGNPPFAKDFPSSDTPFYHSEIPSELFENVVLEHFDISPEEFRERVLYDPESDTYPWQDIDCNNVLYYPDLIPEVTKATDNADGTVTLLVNVICPDKHTDHLFEHEVTMRIRQDGSFRYLSNKIVYRSENELPSPQARIEIQRFDAEG